MRGILTVRHSLIACATIMGVLVATVAQAAHQPSVVQLKTSCAPSDSPCYTTPVDLLNWIANTYKPNAAEPLLISIGPGVFTLPSTNAFCPYNTSLANYGGFITIKGAGQNNTILTGGGLSGTSAVLVLAGCTQVSVQDLTIRTGTRGGSGTSVNGIVWQGGGTSTWTNVSVEASQSAWIDQAVGSCAPGKHNWFSGKLDTKVGSELRTFYSKCGQTKFYGGDIGAFNEGSAGATASVVVQAEGNNASVQLIGSAVRSISKNYPSTISIPIGLYALNGATISHSGGEVSVRAEDATDPGVPTNNLGVTGAKASTGATIYTPNTSFGLRSGGTATALRIDLTGGGTVQAPFQWPAGTKPPVATNQYLTNYWSAHGQDMYVETDCDITAGCKDSATGTQPHLLIFDQNCVSTSFGPWFDIVTRKCRGM